MKLIDIRTIYNIPERISGIGWVAHLIGFCLFIALFLSCLPEVFIDNNWIKDSIELIISSGILVILGMAFIFIFCPVYFFIRCIMEIFRTIKCRHEFYSTPNIRYIKLNENSIFFKNTCDGFDFSIKKTDIIEAIFDAKIKIAYHRYGHRTIYMENATLSIKTQNNNYIIFPDIMAKQVQSKWHEYVNIIDLLKQQIAFYNNYFNNFYLYCDSDLLNIDESFVNCCNLKSRDPMEIPDFLKK